LALILTILFSFILTTLEAARIRGATAYTSMVTRLAGESFLASYYYPLFKQYRLFGVNAGDEKGSFSEDAVLKNIRQDIMCGLEGQEGALIGFRNTETVLNGYQTMLSEGEAGFLEQVRQQVLLDGSCLLLGELFPAETLSEAGAVGKIYSKQEEALEATANVTKEVLCLMEQIDGIKMGSNGIKFDHNGKLQANAAFVKQIVPMEQRLLRESYGNEEVYLAVADKFYRVDRAAEKVLDYKDDIASLNDKINACNRRIERLENSEEAEGIQEILRQERNILRSYKAEKKTLLSKAEKDYNRIVYSVSVIKNVLSQALDTLDVLEEKQNGAKVTVDAYEVFLEGIKTKLSEEVHSLFRTELERMKLYAGLDEQGFPVKEIRKSLTQNYRILSDFSLEGFSEKQTDRLENEMKEVIEGMGNYTTRNLWFSYGDIVVAKDARENVMGALSELLATDIFSLLGVTDVSEGELNGKELPSDGLEKEGLITELMACIKDAGGLLQDDLTEVINAAGNPMLDKTAVELYCGNYFNSYEDKASGTVLDYEREYLIFGASKDKTNLLAAMLYLVAIRTLLCMVMILKQPERMAELERLGAGVTGFTGMPVLTTVVKYAVMLLWAVEEALIEVAGLLQGKQIAPIGNGTVEFEELFLINKKLIAQKTKQLPDGPGTGYPEYLSLLSLTKGTKEKVYRALDLIQENIRFRYNDGFRIRNVVTELEFTVHTEAKALFDTGIFPGEAYRITCREKRVY